jgi:hypothetical protein
MTPQYIVVNAEKAHLGTEAGKRQISVKKLRGSSCFLQLDAGKLCLHR